MDLIDKERIEKEAEEYAYNHGEEEAYIKGATSEHERMAELLKQERNKAIQECIIAIFKDEDILMNGSGILEKLESFKSE